MRKSKLLLITLAMCIIIGSIPFVMGQSNIPRPPASEKTRISAAETASAQITPNTWIYGKVTNVYPWMGSDYTQVWLSTSSGTITFRVTPASTNNQYLQTQLVNSLVVAQETNHYIYVWADENSNIKGTYTTTNT